ncbi:ABC transporter C family member 13-like protein [Drosera capensis]
MGFTPHTPPPCHAKPPSSNKCAKKQKPKKKEKKEFKSDKAEAIDEFEVEKQRFLSSLPRFNNHSIIACGFESRLRIGYQNDEGDDDELPLSGWDCLCAVSNGIPDEKISVYAISRRGVWWSGKKHLQEKILMRNFPALEVALLSFNMVMMWSNSGKGYVIEYYDWIFKCSRISVWALQRFQEGAVVVLDLMFGIYINIIRMKCAASVKGKSSAEEEPLLHDVDLEDRLNDSQEIASSFSHSMTFNNIHPVLEQGVKKQLDFQDLLPLPPDMNPSLCHDTLRMSWEAQQITNCSNASLTKAIWSAYGWPYFCLGLLKFYFFADLSFGLAECLCSLPLQISIALYLLYTQVNFAFLSEVAITVLLIPDDETKEGRVELTVYKTYAAFSGWFIAGLVLLSAVLMQASRNGNDLWLSYWVDMTRTKSGPDYTLSFYVTPRGRILNRLSSDLYTIDGSLPFILNILLANCVRILGTAVVLDQTAPHLSNHLSTSDEEDDFIH